MFTCGAEVHDVVLACDAESYEVCTCDIEMCDVLFDVT